MNAWNWWIQSDCVMINFMTIIARCVALLELSNKANIPQKESNSVTNGDWVA